MQLHRDLSGAFSARRRGVVLVLVLAVLGAVVPASAWSASKRAACDLISDPAGDTQQIMPADYPQLDIVSGDVATDAKWLTAVIRVTRLSATATSPADGRGYHVYFSIGSANFDASAQLVVGGPGYELYQMSGPAQQGTGGQAGTGLAEMRGVIDVKHHEIRMSIPMSVIKANASVGNAPIDHLAAQTFSEVGANPDIRANGQLLLGASYTGNGADSAYSSKTIYPEAPSCVPVGR